MIKVSLHFPTLIGLCLMAFLSGSCAKSRDGSRYELITGNWIESKIVTNGSIAQAPGRQHTFKSNMKYRMICAVNEYCPGAPDGEWSLLTDTTLQTVFNYEIKVYTIDRADEQHLWLRYKTGQDVIQLRMEPYY